MGFGIYEANEVWNYHRENPLFNNRLGRFSDILNGFYDLAKTAYPVLKSAERINKLNFFNDLKNKGFYVGYNDKLVNPEDQVTKTEYDDVKEVTNRMFKFYKELESLFMTQFETKKEQKEAETNKKNLKVFIDNALNEFSFKKLSKY